MSDEQNPALRAVRDQYKNYPYPPRDPEEERTRLIKTYLGPLAVINHHCFGGRQDFQNGFRLLDAGGGTGDTIIHMAEQLRDTDAQLVYVDMSEQSMAIAKARAEVRGLENIRFINGSLLDLPKMGLEPFDYIVSTGVLHHLVEPTDGLAALRAVLKDDGAMSIMLYARYGRTGIYHIQELMRIINGDEKDPAKKIANTKAVLDLLPEPNWFKRSEAMFLHELRERGDAGVYDLFLHSIDRAYSIPEVYDFLESSDLHLIAFAPHERAIFSPGAAYDDSGLGAMLTDLSERERQAAVELVCGTIGNHRFYAAPRPDTAVGIDEADMIPFFFPPRFDTHFRQQIENSVPGVQLTIKSGRMSVSVNVSDYTAAVVKHIDGQRTLPEIVRDVCSAQQTPSPSENDVLDEIKRLYAQLGLWDLLLLRHASSPPELMRMDPTGPGT